MQPSNGIILNIFEAQLDPKYCESSKLNAYLAISHGTAQLNSKVVSSDTQPKWNQIFYLENQSERLVISLYHKPLILKEVLIGGCALSVSSQTGWVHLFKSTQRVGSIKLSISNEFLPSGSNELQEKCRQKLVEVQNMKNKANDMRLKYKQEKQQLTSSNSSNKLTSLINTLKIEQENYMKNLGEINERKQRLKEEEEFVLQEKDRLAKERKKLEEDEREIRKNTSGLQSDFAELQQIRNKLSLQEKIFKASHRNTKSEGRSSGANTSPYCRAKTNASIPSSISD